MNGKWIAFNVLEEGRYLIYRIRGEDGKPEPVPVKRDRGPLYQGLRFGLSPDGSKIAYVSMTGSDFEYSVFTAPIEGGASRRIDQHIRSRRSVLAHIPFDIAVADLQVPHISATLHNSASVVITDMRVADINLMQVNMVEEDSDAAIFINVTIGNNDIAVSLGQVDAVQDFTNRQL